MDLPEAQWKRLAPQLPKPRTRPNSCGHPWRDPHYGLNGVPWGMRTGAP